MIKISKNENEEIRVFIEEFHGRQIFNARVFWKDRNGDWWPSKKGISFAVDKLTDFAEAVETVHEEFAKQTVQPKPSATIHRIH